MSERSYTRGDWAGLITLCRGSCYFPGCPEPVVLVENGVPVLRLEIAHIRALNAKGERYDADMGGDDERNSFNNLILLCTAHHKIVDRLDPANYPVEVLQRWKSEREAAGLDALAGLRNVTEERLQQIISESFETVTGRVDNALAQFAEIDVEAASLLRELVEALPSGSLLSFDAAAMVGRAGRDLRQLGPTAAVLLGAAGRLQGLPDTAEILLGAAGRLQGLSDTASVLLDAAGDLRGLPDTASVLVGAVSRLQGLAEMVSALQTVVDDLKQYTGSTSDKRRGPGAIPHQDQDPYGEARSARPA
jgi:hypothetical protein